MTNFQIDLLDEWFVPNSEIIKNFNPKAVFIGIAIRYYWCVCVCVCVCMCVCVCVCVCACVCVAKYNVSEPSEY